MVIRDEQLSAFRAAAVEDFQARAVAHLKEHYPDRFGPAPDAEVRRFVLGAEAKARDHGLTTEQAVVCVAHLRCLVGDDWDGSKWGWIPNLLGNRDHDPNDRAKLAVRLAQEKLAQDAK